MKDKKDLLIIILFILVISLGGFVVYDNFMKKDSCVGCNDEGNYINRDDNTKDDAWTLFTEKMIKNRKVSNEYDNGINIVMDKDGSVYYSGTMDENAVGTKGKYNIDGYDAGINIEADGISHILDGYKLPITNVISYYCGVVGNGGWKDYIFIKADGTIGRLTYYSTFDSNGNSVVKIQKFEDNVSGYKKIVGMIQDNGFGGHGYRLYDIYGNVYSI